MTMMPADHKWPHTLKTGCRAFLDSFAGLIPVKVLSVTSDRRVTFEVTETIGAYKKGDRDWSSTMRVVPTGAIHRREYSTTIRPYNVQIDN
jgi:hypothetical protein